MQHCISNWPVVLYSQNHSFPRASLANMLFFHQWTYAESRKLSISIRHWKINSKLTVLHPSLWWTRSPRVVDTTVHVAQFPSVTCAAVWCSPDESAVLPPHNAPSTLGLQRVTRINLNKLLRRHFKLQLRLLINSKGMQVYAWSCTKCTIRDPVKNQSQKLKPCNFYVRAKNTFNLVITFFQGYNPIFTVRRYALHGLNHRNSVCPSVCHTRALCPHGSTYDHDLFTIW